MLHKKNIFEGRNKKHSTIFFVPRYSKGKIKKINLKYRNKKRFYAISKISRTKYLSSSDIYIAN